MTKHTVTLLLALSLMFGTCVFAENTPAADNTEIAYAVSDIDTAVSLGIIDNAESISAESITRLQFCEYVYNMLSGIKELPTAKLAENPFNDVYNYKLNTLSFLGIVSGKGDKIFAPDDALTREEAAVILYRAADYAGIQLPAVKVDISYSDNGEISPWAISAVYSLKVSDIIPADGEAFRPGDAIAAKQAVSAIVRIYNAAKNL